MNSSFCLYAAGLALAVVPKAADAAAITYDCDTAANHFSELDLPASGARFTVSGNVQLNSLAQSKTYVPIARVQIGSAAAPGETPKAFAGFSVSAKPADPNKTPSGASAIQMLGYNVNGKEKLLPLSVMTKPGTVQPFTLSYDGSKVSVDLGNESKSFPLEITNPTVRIVCSTGEFLFTDLTITSAQ